MECYLYIVLKYFTGRMDNLFNITTCSERSENIWK